MAQPVQEVSLAWFTPTLRRYLFFFIELLLLAAFVRLLRLVEPFIFQVVIDRILPFQREASLIVIVVIFLAVTAFQVAFSLLSNLVGLRSANRVTYDLGRKIIRSLLTRPYAHFRQWDVGENIARINETDTIRHFLVGASISGLLDVSFAFLYIAVLYTLSPTLTAIILISMPVQVLVYFSFGPILRHALQNRFDSGARHQSNLVERISGISVLKAVGAEEESYRLLSGSLRRRLVADYRVGYLQAVNLNIVFAVNQTITIAIIYVGANLVFTQELTLGQLIAFHLIASRVSEPIINFSAIWEDWQKIRISRRRLADIVLTKPEPFGELPRLPDVVEPRLDLVDVTFGYDPAKPVIKNFSLQVAPYSMALIVGPSGVGKSTFGRLASGLEVPDDGKVVLGGHDIAKFDPQSVRENLVYVPQTTYLFNGSIRDNLLLGRDDIDEAEMWAALDAARAGDFIRQMAGGLDASVGERGSGLSGGQSQRVAIARAFLRAPRVMILDEPTSALDGATEAHIADTLDALRARMSLIVITHRPEIFRQPDKMIDFGGVDEKLD
ncbi:peptidase domain-containing ABC transporter [uncultured Roseobacter sp.]|uniref:peptidase domain-containing ABC transporter n=1 Tax=uncultured Roseobacter sp. TaxID=114847 RepID=UPI00260DD1F7|nr:peptidase domain-containing ABC transporter [uncultured Roseobacter sp.]